VSRARAGRPAAVPPGFAKTERNTLRPQKVMQAARLPANEGTGTVIARWLRIAAITAVAAWYAGLAAIDTGWPLWVALAVLAGGLAIAYALAKWGIRVQFKARFRKAFRRARAQAITIRSGS
jgi:hypothetical protein